MKQYLEILKKCLLFEGIEEPRLPAVLDCLHGTVKEYGKNQAIFLEGEPAGQVGILLSGEVQIVKEDYFGNRSLVAQIEPAQLFGEVFACAQVEMLPVSAIATAGSEVMLLDCKRIVSPCGACCDMHGRLTRNLLSILAVKNLLLNQKIEFTSKRTTKEKLMAYLMAQAKQTGSASFSIPFNRQELADYLGVERSAMSAQLSLLQREGKIAFHKNRFKLTGPSS